MVILDVEGGGEDVDVGEEEEDDLSQTRHASQLAQLCYSSISNNNDNNSQNGLYGAVTTAIHLKRKVT